MDLVNLLLCGYSQGWPDGTADVFGPGPRGALPVPAVPPREEHDVVYPMDPTPGAATMVERLVAAFAADLSYRVRASGKTPRSERVQVHDVLPPAGRVVDPDIDIDLSPTCEPWLVMTDEGVRATATLVRHRSMYPALANRFETF